MKKNILFIAPLCLDDTSAGIAERAFIDSVIKGGHSVSIVCINGNMLPSSLNCEVYRVKENRLFFYISRVLDRLYLSDWSLTPDYYRYSWNRRAYRVIKRICENNQYDLIHSFSFPCSSHLLANKVKKQFGIPWVAHFMDPWVGNPVRNIKSQRWKEYDESNEKMVVNNADIILHTNNKIIEDWKSRYQGDVKDKIFQLSLINSWYPTIINQRGVSSAVTITHIGTLYAGRTARPILRALKIVNDRYPNLSSLLQVLFIGGFLEGDIEATQKNGLIDVVKWLGRLPEKECERYYLDTDLFLAIDCSYKYDFFYPSKILKYFSSQHPILGLVSGENTVLAEEMKSSRNTAINLRDTEAIADFIIGVLEKKVDISGFDKDYWKNYTPDSVLERYNELLSFVL